MKNMQIILFLFISLIYIHLSVGKDGNINNKKHVNKYTAEANISPSTPLPQRAETYDSDFRKIEKPFRMAKLNLVWSKAQRRLTEPKLKSIFNELKIQDKEELTWKQLSAQSKDKDGLKEADLRKKLLGIMSTYGLLEHFEDTQDPEKYKHHKAYSGPVDNYNYKSLFKDKKLNRLWEKAEVSGFTTNELNALKEEFMHHQDKVDIYYNLLEHTDIKKNDYHENAVNEDELDTFNEIEKLSDAEEVAQRFDGNKQNKYLSHANLLREKHIDIRNDFDRLERIAARGPNSTDFIEPKVQGLWGIATHSNFSVDELASLKVELLHYESRLLKLRHLHAEQAMHHEKYKNNIHADKHDKVQTMKEHIKKQSRKVEKLHENIERRLFKHSEL